MAEANNSILPHWLKIILVGRRPHWTAIRIVITTAMLILGARFVVLPIQVHGASMAPTYRENGVNLVNRLSYRFHEPRRGDVIAIRLAGPSVMLMKRIVGLPGETVGFVRGRVYINGQLLDEPYVKFPCQWEEAPRQLGPTEYFVVGDNRSMPIEDHTYGVADRARILGKVLL